MIEIPEFPGAEVIGDNTDRPAWLARRRTARAWAADMPGTTLADAVRELDDAERQS